MKKNEFKVILVIFLIMISILILVICLKNGKKQKPDIQPNQNNVQNTENEFVEVKADGTKVNVSNKLKQDKTIDGLTITNITIQEKNNLTVLKAIVKNPTNTVKGNYEITLKIKDKDGNIIKEIAGYINTIKAKEQTTLSIKTSYDFANAYDFEIIKK